MMSTIRCGAETALGPNGQLSRLDEATGSVQLWDQSVGGIFRYCFVPQDTADLRNSLPFLREMFHFEQSEAQLVVGWRFQESGQFHLRSRFLASSLQRASWEVVKAEGIALASRYVERDTAMLAVPSGCDASLQGAFLLVGGHLSLSDLCGPPFAASMRHFCVTQRMQPSLEFIEAACAAGALMAYVSTASDVRHGLVLIGPESQAPDLLDMRRKGLIAEPLWDAEASNVWAS